MEAWSGIVGPILADLTVPRRLSQGTLTIGCSGPVAMELQHLSTELLKPREPVSGGADRAPAAVRADPDGPGAAEIPASALASGGKGGHRRGRASA